MRMDRARVALGRGAVAEGGRRGRPRAMEDNRVKGARGRAPLGEHPSPRVDHPWVVLHRRPASLWIVDHILGTTRCVLRRTHPAVKVVTLPKRCPATVAAAELVGRHTLPGRRELPPRHRKDRRCQDVHMVIHHDCGADTTLGGVASTDDPQDDLPLVASEAELIAAQPPSEADDPPGMLPMGHDTTARWREHAPNLVAVVRTTVIQLTRAWSELRRSRRGRSPRGGRLGRPLAMQGIRVNGARGRAPLGAVQRNAHGSRKSCFGPRGGRRGAAASAALWRCKTFA